MIVVESSLIFFVLAYLQEMKTLIEKLDPEENGRISFDGFCKGIHDFLGKWLPQIIHRPIFISLHVRSLNSVVRFLLYCVMLNFTTSCHYDAKRNSYLQTWKYGHWIFRRCLSWPLYWQKILFPKGVNGDIILNGSGNEAHDFVDDDSYPRLTISAVENDQQEDSCCEVF